MKYLLSRNCSWITPQTTSYQLEVDIKHKKNLQFTRFLQVKDQLEHLNVKRNIYFSIVYIFYMFILISHCHSPVCFQCMLIKYQFNRRSSKIVKYILVYILVFYNIYMYLYAHIQTHIYIQSNFSSNFVIFERILPSLLSNFMFR